MWLLQALTLMSALAVSFGFSYGPPLESCVDMFPAGHTVDSEKQNTSPYTLSVNASTYQPGDVIEIILNSTGLGGYTFFEGAMVQARRANCSHLRWAEAVGTFMVEANETFLGYMNCQGGERNTIAHIDHAHIYNRRFFWTAPSPSVGHIYFKGVVARRKVTFWSTVSSEFIQDPSDASKLPTEKCTPRTKLDMCPANTPEPKDPSTASVPKPVPAFILGVVYVFFTWMGF